MAPFAMSNNSHEQRIVTLALMAF